MCDIDSAVIEESPKWHLLSMVLDEIRKESATNTKSELYMYMYVYPQLQGIAGAYLSCFLVARKPPLAGVP